MMIPFDQTPVQLLRTIWYLCAGLRLQAHNTNPPHPLQNAQIIVRTNNMRVDVTVLQIDVPAQTLIVSSYPAERRISSPSPHCPWDSANRTHFTSPSCPLRTAIHS